jgi:ribosomal protein L37E
MNAATTCRRCGEQPIEQPGQLPLCVACFFLHRDEVETRAEQVKTEQIRTYHSETLGSVTIPED